MAIWAQTYDLTPPEYEEKCHELLNDGVSISGPNGKINHPLPWGNSMELEYAYDGTRSLTISLIRCTAFTSEVEKKINKWFTGE